MSTTPSTLVSALRATAAGPNHDRGITFYPTHLDSVHLDYREIDRRARAIAAGLAARGHRPGDAAVIALQPGIEWAYAAYGVLYAGMLLVPAPVGGYGPGAELAGRVAGIATASGAVTVVTDAGVLDRVGGDAAGLPSPVLLEDLEQADPETWTDPAIDADSIAALLYTSGSTGDPKGSIATHGSLMAAVEACAEFFEFSDESVMVGWAPLHHAMGLALEVLVPATIGATSVITSPEQFQRRPVFWLELISRHRGTTSVAGNFAFAVCTRLATDEQVRDLDLSSLTVLLCGSEPIDAATVEAFIDRFASTGLPETAFAPAFGMSEAMLVTAKPVAAPLRIDRFDPEELEGGALVRSEGAGTAVVSCGTWATGTTILVVDPDRLEVVPDGTIGEVWVAGPSVGPGYYARPDATAETFGHRLPGDDREYLRTGDLGAVIDRELYLTGRLKEQINIRGRKVYPQDLEATARAVHPSVVLAAAFELTGQPSVAGIVLEIDPEAVPDGTGIDAIAADVQATLVAKYSLPSLAVGVVDVASLPRTATGKVRRRPTHEILTTGGLTLRYAKGFRPDLLPATAVA